MGEPDWDRLVLIATSAWVLPYAPPRPAGVPEPQVSARRCVACVHPGEETGAATPTGGRPARDGRRPPQVAAAVERHEALLTDILQPDRPGLAYASRASDPRPRYAMQARTDPLPGREFAAGADADAVVDSVLGRLERHLRVPPGEWVHEEPFVLRHRLIMDRPRFEAVTSFVPPEPTELDYFVTLDFRFVRGAEHYQRWHLSIAIWSELPFGVEHRPPLDDQHRWRIREADEAVLRRRPRHYRDLFEAAARHAEEWLEARGYEHSRLNISGRRYMQPDFWIAVPSRRTAPDQYLTAADRPGAEITRTMLRVDSAFDDTLSASVLNGDYLVLRQMAAGIDGARQPDRRFQFTRHPLYLIIVGEAPWCLPSRGFHVDDRYTPVAAPAAGQCAHHQRCQRYEYVARQEFCMRDLIDALADIETYAAFTLYEVHNDMQVWENHLRVYETTAAAGARLWDALATHLPIRRMRQLGRVHHAVELMHQTLLQGIADLNDLNTLARECRARVNRARDALNDRFDDMLLQRHLDLGNPGLRAALNETGVFAQLASAAANLVDHAGRVAERYQDVIDAVKDAFDERRVREGDAIQKAGVILALSLAFDSIVSIVSATEPERTGEQGAWLPVLAWTSGSIVLLTALLFGVWMTRLGRLGDESFRTRYDGTRRRGPGRFRRDARTDGLWRFMKNSSTDALEGHLRDARPPAFWRKLDRRLVADLSALWDRPRSSHYPPVGRTSADLYTPARRPDLVGADIAELHAQVGSWSIDALLFTERARRLYRYRLPRLALLYRCIGRMPASFLRLEHLAPTTNIVSESELDTVMRRYARAVGAQPHRPDGTEIGQCIDHHLQARRPRTAAEAAEAIDVLLDELVPPAPELARPPAQPVRADEAESDLPATAGDPAAHR
ncbi:hypothetical protein GCM10009661_31410 [Catellatospora chokoriensis]|uniref:Uncharacterized protein n=1 Tax=Catellatospora chokoriensis TaxID=310353 RepID=A0A8J3K4L4_9ACTN|nr:hypothetical protein Cch02nite_36270 [Catellatospora chokoriensis]